MIVRIRQRTDCEKLILAIIGITLLEGSVSIFIPQIHPIFYLTDLLNVVLFLVMVVRRRFSKLFNSSLRGFIICFALFGLCAISGIIINFSNIALHLWGIRRIFANLIFFLACVLFEHSYELKFINKLFWINLAVSIIEGILGYRQDWVGGIYGIVRGNVNGPLNLLLIIIMTKIILDFINKEANFKQTFFIGVALLGIATFAELKIFYVEIVILIALCSLVTKFSFRKLMLIVFGGIGAIVGIKLLFVLFPDISPNMFTISNMWRYLTNPGGYVGQFAGDTGDMNRLAFWDKAMAQLPDMFDKLFGLGLGNTEYIEVLGLKSQFYITHRALHYFMFPLPMILLQMGTFGMILYLMLFALLFLAIRKQKVIAEEETATLYQMAEVLCLMAFVITVYDTSLLGKGGFLYFYVLSLPFIKAKGKGGSV